jgi:hypothetical protein
MASGFVVELLGWESEGKRLLFLKKKKQKNFSPFGSVGWRCWRSCVDIRKWTKVFWFFFFKKRTACFLFP